MFFFYADLWNAKAFSMLIILIASWQVLSYLISCLFRRDLVFVSFKQWMCA